MINRATSIASVSRTLGRGAEQEIAGWASTPKPASPGCGFMIRPVAMLGHFDRIAGKVRRMVPSLDPDDPGFQMIRYWRGPVWAVVNWMIGQGLAEAGHADRAERVRTDTLALIGDTGFYEAFSPLDGVGSGGDDFSWTAAILLAWRERPGLSKEE